MRLIKVPEVILTVRYEDDDGKVTIKQENYFWYVLKVVIRQQIGKMSGLQVVEFEDCHEEILAQDGKATLKIKRESEYEKLKGWVENLTGWPGKVEDVVKNTAATIRAFREAEKVRDSEAAKK